MKITKVSVDRFRLPITSRREGGKTSLSGIIRRDANPEVVDLITAAVETDAGVSGLGFTYVLGAGASAVRNLLETDCIPLVIGENAHDVDRLHAKAAAHFRSIGFEGPAARAYTAIDVALWDLKAKSAGVPLYRLLGDVRENAPYFTSDYPNTWEVDELARAVSAKTGGLRVEIGFGDVNVDAERIGELHEAIGEEVWLGVAAGGRYDLNTALALAHFFEDRGLDWFEDPIPTSDLQGYARIADRFEILVAVGSCFSRPDDFYRTIRDGLARVVRPDPCRLGGITPILPIARVAEAYHVAVTPFRATEIGVHLARGIASVKQIDSTSWFKYIFDYEPNVSGINLSTPEKPGLGIAVNEEFASRYRIMS